MAPSFTQGNDYEKRKNKVDKESIRKVLTPELELIKSPDLQKKTVKAWALACQISGYDRIDEIPSPGFSWLNIPLIQHVKQVARIAAAILDILSELGAKLNRDHVITGALCHDVGVPLEMRKKQKGFYTPLVGGQRPGIFYGENPNMPTLEPGVSYQVARHSTYGFYVTMAVGMPEHVAHIVGAHSREGDLFLRTPEATLIHFVDLLWWYELGGWAYPTVPEWRGGEPFHWREVSG